MPTAPSSPEQKPSPGTHGDPPAYRASSPDSGDVTPLDGSELGATVRPRPHPDDVAATARPGDAVDGDEGSATGSRTPGHPR